MRHYHTRSGTPQSHVVALDRPEHVHATSRLHVAGASFPFRKAAQPDFLPIFILTDCIFANFFNTFNIDTYTDHLAVLSDLFTILASYRRVLRTRRHLVVSII